MGDKISKINKIKRKLSFELYHAAAFYTILLLLLGFLAGIVYDKYMTDNLREQISTLSDSSFTSEILYALEGSDEFCDIYPYTIKRVEAETWRIGNILTQLESDHRLPEDLKLRYFDMELRDFFLSKRAYESCNISSIFILYFYSNDVNTCFDCSSEGFELTIARNKLLENNYTIKIYAFDGEANHEIIKYLKKRYSIEKYPTIVLIYKDKLSILEGFTKSDDMVRAINRMEED